MASLYSFWLFQNYTGGTGSTGSTATMGRHVYVGLPQPSALSIDVLHAAKNVPILNFYTVVMYLQGVPLAPHVLYLGLAKTLRLQTHGGLLWSCSTSFRWWYNPYLKDNMIASWTRLNSPNIYTPSLPASARFAMQRR
jgi:hypothetical protein